MLPPHGIADRLRQWPGCGLQPRPLEELRLAQSVCGAAGARFILAAQRG